MLSYKLSRSLTPYTRTGVAVTPDQTQAQARESDQCTSYYVSIRKFTTWRKGPRDHRTAVTNKFTIRSNNTLMIYSADVGAQVHRCGMGSM